MIEFILVVSFLLDGTISMLVSTSSLLLPVCTITSFIIIYPFFKNNLVKYLLYLGIVGILYDICYGDIYLLNVIIFCILGLLIKLLDYLFTSNIFTNILKIVILIICYRIISYIVALILGGSISLSLLFTSIYKSLILNVIYGTLLYAIFNKKRC